ncbi:MAG: Uma2 family endonuclease [Chloroflexaceae bacterium]|nr:Uma2 family endonuclease [Chloroflexaceae bacterium]
MIPPTPRPVVQQTEVYPESDGQPMANNTEHFSWIVLIKENLEAWFQDRTDVFVAGDLFWYPVEGHAEIRRAPDTMVVFGRPKGPRSSYCQWDEEGIGPQVVFEIHSPGNKLADLFEKFVFYDQYGVEEYYLYDPDSSELTVFLRQDDKLRLQRCDDSWTSPLLGMRFDLGADGLRLWYPDGQPFVSFSESERQRRKAEQRAERLATRLRELGIDPDAEM